ncbi:MAG: winged helix-turn-helix transcriptional regulator [Clostridia bacterium]|nr:winged helix-turn-helix transcriptional regulator [Clostridia bacterium]
MMVYNKDIAPCFDATIYLCERFAKDRASKRIRELPTKHGIDTNCEQWQSVLKIADLEQKLDELFKPDDLMLRYFTPLQTVNSPASVFEITFGQLLLRPRTVLSEPIDFDSIVDFYKTAEQETIISQFSTHLFNSFAKDEQHEAKSINELVALADKMLIKLDDKWLFIDIALNPLQHLEKLRPLVCAVSDAIANMSAEFNGLLNDARDSLESLGEPERLLKKLNLDLKSGEIGSISIHPSLTAVNMVSMCVCTRTDDSEKVDIQLFIGVYVCVRLAQEQNSFTSPEAYLYTLKLISDPTRFSVLHELCDKSSYGQELAQKFKCTRSAMYYHLEKLDENHLIVQEITGYRMLYTLDKRSVYDKFNAMRDYILNGWKPEDDEKNKDEE